MSKKNIYIKILSGDLLHLEVKDDMTIFDIKILIDELLSYNPHYQILFRIDRNYIFNNKEKVKNILKDEEMIGVILTDNYDKNNWKYVLEKYSKKKKDINKIYVFFIKDYEDYLENRKRFEIYTMKYSYPNKKWIFYIYDMSYTELYDFYKYNTIIEEEISQNYQNIIKKFSTVIDPYFHKLINNFSISNKYT